MKMRRIICRLFFAGLLLAEPMLQADEPAFLENASMQETPAASITVPSVMTENEIENNAEAAAKTEISAPKEETGKSFLPEASLSQSIIYLLLALGIVFVLFYGMKRFSPKLGSALPAELFETLGEFPLSGKIRGRVVRFGSKLILLAVSADRIKPLAELTDPQEVKALLERCKKRTKGGEE